MSSEIHTGGCQCGAIRFRVTGELKDASVCHCRMCQKAFGAYYAPLVSTRGALLEWTRGEPKRFRSSNVVQRGFCADCGTPLTYEAPDGVALAAGAFDDPAGLAAKLTARGIRVRFRPNAAPGGLRLTIGTDGENQAALAALGVAAGGRPSRRATAARDTKETRIAVAIDLDAAAPRNIATGIPFYDHMLDQVAAHGGFALTLACEGDLEIDAHHSIEDCAIAFGQALRAALGDRRGIGRFGFALPMDEAEAQVLIDLSGRPFSRFEGDFAASHIGAYPTEMTAHVFRSLADTLGAAIHVKVSGENDHHKTEACFKALGRALRQAIAREGGDALPSTKGVL